MRLHTTARFWISLPRFGIMFELDQAGRLLALNSQRHLRPAREMAALFRDVRRSD